MENCSSCAPQVFNIFTGDDAVMNLQLKSVDDSGSNPVDLTACTEIDVAIANQDGSFAHFLLTLGEVVIVPSALLGNFTVTIPSDESLLFNVGVMQSFNVTFTISALKTTVQYYQALSVLQNS